MKFGFTASTDDIVGGRINASLVYFENTLNEQLGEKFYGAGIVRFVVCFVSIDDENEINIQHQKHHTKVGKYRDDPADEWGRYISIAPIVLPKLLCNAGEQEVISLLMVSLISEIEMGRVKWPKGFDLIALASDVKKSFNKERCVG